MSHDPSFESPENQALLVVCARKTIRRAAIAGIVWGAINLVVGIIFVRINPLNAGILVLAVIMLGTGVSALRKPTHTSLRSEALVSVLLLVWNVAIAGFNVHAGAGAENRTSGHGIIFPAIAAVLFYKEYRRLGHLSEAIETMEHDRVKAASELCKSLFKTKLKQAPDVAEESRKRCRFRFMTDSVFCAQRNLARAFHMSRDHFQSCIPNPEKKRVRVVVRHPLGKLTYAFDKKNSEKIKSWLGPASAEPV